MSLPFKKIRTCLSLFDTMPFGKYQGLTLARVIEDDYRYVFWCINNIDFYLDDVALNVLQNKPHNTKPVFNYVVDYDMEDDIPF